MTWIAVLRCRASSDGDRCTRWVIHRSPHNANSCAWVVLHWWQRWEPMRLPERLKLWRIKRRFKNAGTLAGIRWCLGELGFSVVHLTDRELANRGHALFDVLRASGMTTEEVGIAVNRRLRPGE